MCYDLHSVELNLNSNKFFHLIKKRKQLYLGSTSDDLSFSFLSFNRLINVIDKSILQVYSSPNCQTKYITIFQVKEENTSFIWLPLTLECLIARKQNVSKR